MARRTSSQLAELARAPGDYLSGRTSRAERESSDTFRNGMLLAGLVALGVGFVAWHYLGADLRRYIKIHQM